MSSVSRVDNSGHVDCFIQGHAIRFQLLIAFSKGVLMVSSSLKRKLLRSSWHLFRLTVAQCGRTGRNAVLGQQPKGMVARLSVSPHRSAHDGTIWFHGNTTVSSVSYNNVQRYIRENEKLKRTILAVMWSNWNTQQTACCYFKTSSFFCIYCQYKAQTCKLINLIGIRNRPAIRQ